MARAGRLFFIAVIAVLIAFGGLYICVMIAEGRSMPLPVAILIAMALIMIGVAVTAYDEAARRRRAMEMLSYLEQAVQLNLPLPRMFLAFAQTEANLGAGSRFRRQIQQAREALESGALLASALSAWPQIPRRVLTLIAGAERAGRLPQVLARLMQQRREAVARGLVVPPFYSTYPLILFAAFVGVTSMFLVFVAPKFETIYANFGIPLPWVTQITVMIGYAVGPWSLLLLGLLFLAIVLSVIGAQSSWSVFGIIESPAGWIANRLPWIATVRMHRALGDVLLFAADAIDAGWPIDRALAEAAQIPANSRLRTMVQAWLDAMSRGQSIPDAARAAGMPPMVVSMLATSVNTPDVAQVLRFLGRYYASRFSRALILLRAAVMPLVAITMGVLVAWLALSVFLPLLSLVNNISGQSSP